MGNFASKLRGVTLVEFVVLAAVAVLHCSLQYEEKLDAWMLVKREHIGGLGEASDHRFDGPGRSPKGTQIEVAVSEPGPLVDDLMALARSHDDQVVLLVESSKECSEGYVGRFGQTEQGVQAWSGLAVLDLRQHPEGDLSSVGEGRHSHSEVSSKFANAVADETAEFR